LRDDFAARAAAAAAAATAAAATAAATATAANVLASLHHLLPLLVLLPRCHAQRRARYVVEHGRELGAADAAVAGQVVNVEHELQQVEK
jgi:hypothetical protein